jgi:hypothetical protein
MGFIAKSPKAAIAVNGDDVSLDNLRVSGKKMKKG